MLHEIYTEAECKWLMENADTVRCAMARRDRRLAMTEPTLPEIALAFARECVGLGPDVIAFIRASNAIENIHREPTAEEIAGYERFMSLNIVTVKDLEQFVSVYAPGHKLRSRSNMNVSVGGILCPAGWA